MLNLPATEISERLQNNSKYNFLLVSNLKMSLNHSKIFYRSYYKVKFDLDPGDVMRGEI